MVRCRATAPWIRCPNAVELVPPLELLEPLAGESHLEVRVLIAVALLDPAQQSVRSVEELLQLGHCCLDQLGIGQRPPERLEPLVLIAVHKGQITDKFTRTQADGEF